MKILEFALCGLIFVIVVSASPLQRSDGFSVKQTPLECSKGPVFWCQNLKNSKACGATTHCIQTVWTKHLYPVDNDSICQICLDMVKQARDQLLSNETQEDLKAVFEGSCNLIPVKLVRKECDKLADDFVPELVEALSSQMNPQVVCTVAGLCNNAAIDKLLAQQKSSASVEIIDSGEEVKPNKLSCGQCNSVGSLIAQKFRNTNRDKILENMLNFCGELSSFSDGCSNIILTYFNEIYDALNAQLTAGSICHMSGVCAELYHQHNDEKPKFSVEVILPKDDDIPCDLCKQLVGHLRDLLIANTTEAEFKTVLEGVCKQTKSFKSECTSIVDQYYDVIYNTLTHNLDENGACFMIGICPKGPKKSQVPMIPMVPIETRQLVLGRDEPIFSAYEIQQAQLPKDQLLISPPQVFGTLQGNGQLCALCEYVLHFVQESLASPVNEENIKKAAEEKCKKLPEKYAGQCVSFVDTYGDAVIALLIQDIDPSQVCPKLTFCGTPSAAVPKPIQAENFKNEKCPLCLFLVQELEEKLKTDKSKENIKKKLDTVCDHLSDQMRSECQDFVHTYTNELVDKVADNFSPEQICVYINCCTPKDQSDYYRLINNKHKGYDIETNTIEDNTINGQVVIQDYDRSLPECLMCEQVIKEVEKKAGKNKSKVVTKEIIEYLEHACTTLDKPDLRQKCADFVEKNADILVEAITKELKPKQVCRDLGFCSRAAEDSQLFDSSSSSSSEEEEDGPMFNVNYYESGLEPQPEVPELPEGPQPPTCALCELIISKVEKDITDKKTRDEIEKSVKNVCKVLPKSLTEDCKKFIDQYSDLIINLIGTVPPKQICTEINLCLRSDLKDKKKLEVLECAVCHAASEELQHLVKVEENKKNRDALIEKACNRLPAKYYQRCSSFLEIYLESVINLIEQSGELPKICEQIGMCYPNEKSTLALFEPKQEESKPKKLVGANRCTYGPSYWCSDIDKMAECGAHVYCKSYNEKLAKQKEVEVMGV